MKALHIFSTLIVASALTSIPALAQTEGATSSSSSSSQVLPPAETTAQVYDGGAIEYRNKLDRILGNKEFKDDQTLTDIKLRADAGSMSRFSLKTNLSYYGPIVNDLRAPDQPNPDGGVGSTATAISGSLGLRVRLDPNTTISLGSGLKAIHPMHGMERFDVNNPFMTLDLSDRWGNLQMRNSPGFSMVTIPEYKNVGEYGSLDYSNSLVYNIAESRFAVGLDSSFSYYLFNREYRVKDKKANRSSVSFAPTFKYNVNDKMNVNTSVSFGFWNPREVTDETIMLNKSPTQNLGVGYAFKKDIYLSPYLRFYPGKLAVDTTTINLAASLSLL